MRVELFLAGTHPLALLVLGATAALVLNPRALSAQAMAEAPPNAVGAKSPSSGASVSPPVSVAPTPPAIGSAPIGAVPAPTGGSSAARIGSAEVTVVGGNSASARERAVAEALKQAVDQALRAILPDARTTQPKVVVQVLGRARTYVRRYRTLEEAERAGVYGVRIEAEIDETALLRAFDRPAGPNASGSGSSPPSYLLVGVGPIDAIGAATRAFAAAGARVLPATTDLTEPTKAIEAAARAGISSVAFVSGSATTEGKVRGPGVEAVSCTIGLRVLASGSGRPIADESETVRAFAETPDKARADCFTRAAAAVIARVVPVEAVRSTPDVRTIVLDADVVEPGAVAALMRQLRGIGSVSAVEVRRIGIGHVELWVRSRLAGAALAAALDRVSGGSLALSDVETTGDLVRVRARLREPSSGASTPPTSPTGPAGGASQNGATNSPPSPSPSPSPSR